MSVFVPVGEWCTLTPLFSSRTAETTARAYSFGFILVFFRGKSSGRTHGVDFQVSARGTSDTTFRPKMVLLDVNEHSFNYKFPPPPIAKYGANERLFVLVKGAIGLRTRVKITDFNSEACCDYLKAAYLDPTKEYTFRAYTYVIVTTIAGFGLLMQ